jgi:hypothetical protein
MESSIEMFLFSAITLNNLTSSNEENKRRLRKECGVELLIRFVLFFTDRFHLCFFHLIFFFFLLF